MRGSKSLSTLLALAPPHRAGLESGGESVRASKSLCELQGFDPTHSGGLASGGESVRASKSLCERQGFVPTHSDGRSEAHTSELQSPAYLVSCLPVQQKYRFLSLREPNKVITY